MSSTFPNNTVVNTNLLPLTGATFTKPTLVSPNGVTSLYFHAEFEAARINRFFFFQVSIEGIIQATRFNRLTLARCYCEYMWWKGGCWHFAKCVFPLLLARKVIY